MGPPSPPRDQGKAQSGQGSADGEPLTWDVAGGFLSVTADGVTILAETVAPTQLAETR